MVLITIAMEGLGELHLPHLRVMLLLFATPVVWGFGNYILPLQIGAPDVAFPRLNAFGFWVTLLGGTVIMALAIGAAVIITGDSSPRLRAPKRLALFALFALAAVVAGVAVLGWEFAEILQRQWI